MRLSPVEWSVLAGVAGALALAFLCAGIALARRLLPSRKARRVEAMRVDLARVAAEGAELPESTSQILRSRPSEAREAFALESASRDPSAIIRLRDSYRALGLLDRADRDLRSQSWWRRAEAAVELGNLRFSEYVAPLVALLRDPVPEVRSCALRALCAIGSPAPLGPIFDALHAAGRWSICLLHQLLERFGPSAGPEALGVLEQPPSRHARLLAIEALGLLRCAESVPRLRQMMGSPDNEDRIRSARALGRIGSGAAYPELTRGMLDPVWEVRASAATALGELGRPEAVDALERALMDPAWWVRRNAAAALIRLGPEGKDRLARSMGHSDAFARDMATHMLEAARFGEARA